MARRSQQEPKRLSSTLVRHNFVVLNVCLSTVYIHLSSFVSYYQCQVDKGVTIWGLVCNFENFCFYCFILEQLWLYKIQRLYQLITKKVIETYTYGHNCKLGFTLATPLLRAEIFNHGCAFSGKGWDLTGRGEGCKISLVILLRILAWIRESQSNSSPLASMNFKGITIFLSKISKYFFDMRTHDFRLGQVNQLNWKPQKLQNQKGNYVQCQ